jgi:hypothetical protein
MWTATAGLEATTAAPAGMAAVYVCALVTFATFEQMLQPAVVCCFLPMMLGKAHQTHAASTRRKFFSGVLKRNLAGTEDAMAVAFSVSP